jgi:MFS family permease
MSLKHDLYLSRKPLAGFVAIGLIWSVYFAQMPVVKAATGASDGVYGIALLFASLGAIGAMWLAPLCDRLAGSWALPLGITVAGVGMLWAGAAGGVFVLALAMWLASAGSGVTDVLINAKLSEVEARSKRSLMNLNHALYSFAYAGGALITGVLRREGFASFSIFAGLFVILLALAWFSRGQAHDDAQEEALQQGSVPASVVWLGGTVVMIAFLAEAASEGWSALHLERTLNGSPAQGALGPAVIGLTMGIGRLSGHWVARYLRDTTLMIAACLLSALGIVIASAAGSVGMALVGFGVAGLGISVVAPLALALVGRVVAPEARLRAISKASVLGYGAFFLGPPLMGMISQGFGLRVSFAVVAVVLAAVAVTVIPLLGRRAAERS